MTPYRQTPEQIIERVRLQKLAHAKVDEAFEHAQKLVEKAAASGAMSMIFYCDDEGWSEFIVDNLEQRFRAVGLTASGNSHRLHVSWAPIVEKPEPPPKKGFWSWLKRS